MDNSDDIALNTMDAQQMQPSEAPTAPMYQYHPQSPQPQYQDQQSPQYQAQSPQYQGQPQYQVQQPQYQVQPATTTTTTTIVSTGLPNPASNSSTRGMINTSDPGSIGIKYRALISEKYKRYLCILGLMYPCSCMLCYRDKIYQSTYVQVHENRIESNYPGTSLWGILCCDSDLDNINVTYYDRKVIQHAEKASCCTPCCTHRQFFPDNCGLCGEMAIVYSTGCCCGLTRRWESLPGLDDAQGLVDAINSAKGTPRVVTMMK